MSTQLQFPAIGWQSAVAPCSECFEIVARESTNHIYAGQQQDCYACQNRMTVARIAQDGQSRTDMLSAWGSDVHVEKKWEVVAIAFHAPIFKAPAMESWLRFHELDGFLTEAAKIKRAIDWVVITKDKGGDVLVLLDEGVIARCRLVNKN